MPSRDLTLMNKVVALTRRRGFIFPGSDIYGGFSGFWDYGPLGAALKENLKRLWWKMFVSDGDSMYGLDSAIIMNPRTWEASGHVADFSDPLEGGERFNTMFKTSIGAGNGATGSYLRPETAQGIFVNFKNIVDCFRPTLPFGVAQIGKAFRNEIAPRDFLFRAREFEQMEIEYFVRPEEWEKHFAAWRKVMNDFANALGLAGVHELEVPDIDRAHYSKRTIDFEFDYPFGRKELWGLAYRGDHDLTNHARFSGTGLWYVDSESKEKIVPHVIEPSLGVDRTILALLVSAYTEDEIGDGRSYLNLPPELSPVRAAVFPLLANKPELVERARTVLAQLKKAVPAVLFDDNGNIGKRYRRQDEIGTPFCVTIDFTTLDDGTVTLRERNSAAQERVQPEEAVDRIKTATTIC